MEGETINNVLNVPHQMALPMNKIRINEAKDVIQNKINPKKAPGCDLITGKILKELPQKGLRAITQIFNAILKIEYFLCQWKVGQIIMIAKPGKNPDDVTSYRPISLLPILSKFIEKMLLKRLTLITGESELIHSHQVGFGKDQELLNRHTAQSTKSTTTWKANATAQRPSST
jgi:hypothetical protein